MVVKNTINLFVTVLLFACASSGYAQTEVVNTDVVFHGKVVDQYYAPVANAEVGIVINYLDQSKNKKTKNVKLKTDQKGFFIFGNAGLSIHIDSLIKDGYEFAYRKNIDTYFEYSLPFQKARFIADQKAPVLFHMTKLKDEPAYLIHQPSQERNFLPNEKSSYNLNLGGNWIDSNGQFQSSSGHLDLAIRCALSKDKNKIKLTLISMDSNSGVIASDKYLELAPAQGYEQETVIEINIPKKTQDIKKYVYVKARGGMMYSRLDLNLTIRPSNLLVRIDSWTNPEYSRNLKYDKAFQQYTKRHRYDIRERHYQENLRIAKNKELFKYVPRTLPVFKTSSAIQSRSPNK